MVWRGIPRTADSTYYTADSVICTADGGIKLDNDQPKPAPHVPTTIPGIGTAVFNAPNQVSGSTVFPVGGPIAQPNK